MSNATANVTGAETDSAAGTPAAAFTSGPTDAQMLALLPEFNDASKYPETARQFWLSIAVNSFDPHRWGQYYAMGCYLWAAHHLVLFSGPDKRRGRGARHSVGLVGSKSVGGVSVSYDTASVVHKDGAHWNLTNYGNRWLDIARMIGMGGVYVGAGPFPPNNGPGFMGPVSGLGGPWVE